MFLAPFKKVDIFCKFMVHNLRSRLTKLQELVLAHLLLSSNQKHIAVVSDFKEGRANSAVKVLRLLI